jgi:putative ABC transport system permease protein
MQSLLRARSRRRLAPLAAALVVSLCAGRDAAARAPSGGPGRVGELLLSERAAAGLGVVRGDTIEAAPTAAFEAGERYVVAGIYRPKADPFEVGRDNLHARFHTDDLERLTGQHDAVQRMVVRLKDPARADIVRDRLRRGAVGFDAYTSQELAEHTSGTFVVISRFQRAIAWLALAAGAVFLVTLMVLKVEERRRELASMTLMGISRRTILVSLALESLVVAVVGGALGVGLGILASAGINGYFRLYYQTDLLFSRVSPAVAGTAALVALPLGVAAAAIAGWRLLRTRELTRGAR